MPSLGVRSPCTTAKMLIGAYCPDIYTVKQEGLLDAILARF